MKIGLDAFNLRTNMRGMARFALQLTRPVEAEVVALKPLKANAQFPVWEQLQLMSEAARHGVDVLLCPYNTAPLFGRRKLPTVVVICDLIFLDRSLQSSISMKQNIGRWYRRLVVPRVARSSFHIVTISHFTEGELIRRFHLKPAEITVIPCALEESWFMNPATDCETSSYLLTVSGQAPSKNLEALVRAFGVYRQEGGKKTLRVLGVSASWHDHFKQIAVESGADQFLEMVGFVSDEELQSTYSGAAGYICASLAEGFGIPVLEAMAKQLPLASSSSTSLPEVAGKSAIYFDPASISEMTAALHALSIYDSLAKERVRIGIENAEQFRAVHINSQIVELWERMRHKLANGMQTS